MLARCLRRGFGTRPGAAAELAQPGELVMGAQTDGVIVGVDEKGELWPGSDYVNRASQGRLQRLLGLTGHTHKDGAVRVLHDVHASFPRVAVVTCRRAGWTGDETRRATAIAARALRDHGAKRVQVERLGSFQAAAEGITLGTYTFDRYKAASSPAPFAEPLCSAADRTKSLAEFDRGTVLAQAQNWARTLAELPPNVLTPAEFAKQATETLEAGARKMAVKVHNQDWIEGAQMNLFLGVARGSAKPPRLMEVRFVNGDPARPHVVLVGKGITFDSGGISIKPSAHMDMMKGDMGGAAAVVAAIKAISDLDLKINVTGIVPLCENMPSGTAMRPGDIIESSGKSVEIINTDAEGRLILGDALYYATANKTLASCVIDVATLTGAIDVALGYYGCGLFTNNMPFFDKAVQAAQQATGEIAHPMPIGRWHRQQIESRVADIKNSTESRSGGAATAAAFLQHFVTNDKPWMHLDMAAVMHSSKTDGYDVQGMTGRPTRLLVELAERLFAQGQQ